jgi:glycosyltransferase involved in cell wall biosynthesis
VDGANVLLVPPEDPRAVCEAALRMEADEAMRRRIGGGARELAATFAWEHIAQRTVDKVFRPLIGS